MITDIMVHWVTGTAHSAMRFYNGSTEHPLHLAEGQRVAPPCGIVRLPAELPMPPRSWAERAFNIVHWTELARGDISRRGKSPTCWPKIFGNFSGPYVGCRIREMTAPNGNSEVEIVPRP